ncbi:hypothetical protein MMC07_007687 [Pseudocyphellaria aurata]|nr:hypothetical protein [Pseudocyphellaria aurata]
MADPEVRISHTEESEEGDTQGDGEEVVVGDIGDVGEGGETVPVNGDSENIDESAVAEHEQPAPNDTFVDFLQSPVIELAVGSGSDQTILSAHQALLVRSSFFASAIAESSNRRIDLSTQDLDAISCFIEYLYTGEYYPRKTSSGTLESDASTPSVDETGEQLLKHAKVYTLAEKLGISALKSLSHSKIHLVTSTAVAEIAYARYVYSHTSSADVTIRKPVASFWGQRSHVLRHQTEGSFQSLCLEFPQFALDVLTFVLDVEEKRERQRDGGERQREANERQRDGGKGWKSSRKRIRTEK